MAYKSLLLSLALSIVLGYCFTAGLTSPNSLLKKLPDWSALLILVVGFVLYLLAGWWGLKGFREHQLTALFSLCLCAFGLGLYALAFVMEIGKNRPSRSFRQPDFGFENFGWLPERPVASVAKQPTPFHRRNRTFSSIGEPRLQWESSFKVI